jgi:amidase
MNDLIYAPVAILAEAIRTGRFSATTLVDAHLRRIDAVNPQINAVVTLSKEARAQAAAADAELARGHVRGPLHGVPMTIKDSLDSAGTVSTWGTPGRAGFVPAEDATVVARLRAAGAILLGKSNTPELTLSFDTVNPIHGQTCNPYDVDRSPGGSSGGAAAMVAAGGAPFDIGSDTGGSIRLPAHCCGVAGIKPTSGRVSRHGHAIPPEGWLNGLTQLGPIARTVADLALLLPIIAGPDGRDPTVAPVPLGDPAAVDVTKIRVALHNDNGIYAAEPKIAHAVGEAGEALRAVGARVVEARPPGIEETLEIMGGLMRGVDEGIWVQRLLARAATPLDQSSLSRYLGLERRTVGEMVAHIEHWHRFRARMLSFLDDFDLILCPVAAFPALAPGEFAGEKYPGFSYTMSYNLTGWPAAVVRAGTSAAGLPIGVQLVAAPWREDVALAAALVVERELGGWRAPGL